MHHIQVLKPRDLILISSLLDQLLKHFPHSVAFAYVADVTDESSRSLGYGLVTAGFAASLIISPALGAGIELLTGETIFSLGSDR